MSALHTSEGIGYVQARIAEADLTEALACMHRGDYDAAGPHLDSAIRLLDKARQMIA